MSIQEVLQFKSALTILLYTTRRPLLDEQQAICAGANSSSARKAAKTYDGNRQIIYIVRFSTRAETIAPGGDRGGLYGP